MSQINGRELVKGLGMMEAAVRTSVVSNNVPWDPQGNFAAKPGAEGSLPGCVDQLLGLVGISLPIQAPNSLGDHQGKSQQAHH